MRCKLNMKNCFRRYVLFKDLKVGAVTFGERIPEEGGSYGSGSVTPSLVLLYRCVAFTCMGFDWSDISWHCIGMKENDWEFLTVCSDVIPTE